MTTIEISIDELRGMIGVTVCHEGTHCKVVEVLEDGPQLVLIDLDIHSIQSDQFGSPHRRVPQTYLIPVISEEDYSLHPTYLALEIIE
jgi:hypothetical protein